MASPSQPRSAERPELLQKRRAYGLHFGGLGIVIPYEFRDFRWRAEQGVPGHCRRPTKYDPRDAERMTNPPAPFVNLCGVSVGHHPESFKPRAQMLQLAALAKAANKGLPVDSYDGFQHPGGHIGQLAKRLLGRREETLEFGDGGRSLLAFDAERLVAADGLGACSGGFLFDRRRERASGKRLAFRLGLDEGRPLDVEPLPDNADCVLELSMCRSRIKESLPE